MKTSALVAQKNNDLEKADSFKKKAIDIFESLGMEADITKFLEEFKINV
jgi:hypothetical protein